MRKYTTEFGLNVYTSYKTVIPAAHLEILEKVDSHKYHIYGILLAPKVFIKEESVVKHRDYFSIILFAYMEDKYTEYTDVLEYNLTGNNNLAEYKYKVDDKEYSCIIEESRYNTKYIYYIW